MTKLTPIYTFHKQESYEDAVKRHLRDLPEDIRIAPPKFLFIGGLMDNGICYQLLTDNSILEVLGALEMIKDEFKRDELDED